MKLNLIEWVMVVSINLFAIFGAVSFMAYICAANGFGISLISCVFMGIIAVVACLTMAVAFVRDITTH